MRGLIFSFAAYTIFAVMDVINKLGRQIEQLAYLSHLFWFMLTFAVMAVMVHIIQYGIKSVLNVYSPKYALLRGLLLVVAVFLVIYVLPSITLVTFYVIVALQPIIVSSISILIGLEKLSWSKIGIILLSFIGVLVHLQVWVDEAVSTDLFTIFIVFLAVTLAGLSGIVSKKYLSQENTMVLMVYQGLIGVIFVTSGIIVTGDTLIMLDLSTWWLVLAGMLSMLGSYCFTKSYQLKSTVQSISQMQYIQIVWGALFGFLLFQDGINGIELIGILIILIAGIINVRSMVKVR